MPPAGPPAAAPDEDIAVDPAPRKPWLEEEPAPGVEEDVGADDPAEPAPPG